MGPSGITFLSYERCTCHRSFHFKRHNGKSAGVVLNQGLYLN